MTATSPALQGSRATMTGAAGDYAFVNIPPGEYTITFSLPGLQPVTRAIKLAASQASRLDVTLSLTLVAAETTVAGRSESISQTTTEATTYTADLLTKLPTARSITDAVVLSPGVSGPRGLSISGAETNESLYTVNGVVITDNASSAPNNLFIEDAIQETTTMTSAISAEFGRFTGGVINTVTKSGGNTFSGSFRTTFTNNTWQSTSGYRTATGANPQEGIFVNSTVPTYEATVGGPILKDKLWFFGAGRYFDTSDAAAALTRFTNIPFTAGSRESRYEGKLTFSPFQNHTLTGSYIGIKHDDVNYYYTGVPVSDLASIYDRQLPQELLAINYNGVLSASFFIEGQYSRRKFTFENAGGIYQDNVRGTVIRDLALGVSYSAPIFCGVCGPERRDNDNFVVKGTYFLSTASLGSHNIVAGYDNFGGQRLSNNYQSGSNYVLYTFGASVVHGSNIYPVIPAGTELDYWPVLQASQGDDLRTQSAYLNDTWRFSNRLSFNIGVRYDKNHALDQGGNLTSNDSAWSPRLAAIVDVKGDGRLRVTASYSKYVSALQDIQAGSSATLAGSPADYYWYYDGPGINTNPNGPFLSPQAALTQVFNWFGAAGCLPDPLAASCKVPLGGPPAIGGVNQQIRGSLASPNALEYVLGLSGNLGKGGTFRADLVRREYHDYYDLKRDMSTGTVVSTVNPEQVLDLGLIVNSNDYTRNYTGLHAQFAYRLTDQLSLGGVWTWSHLIGDVEGTRTTFGTAHSYPEYFDRKWSLPVGSLSGDTRHRVRIYGTYDLPVPAIGGKMTFGVLQAWDTGTPYGVVGSVRSGAYVKNPGYLTPPASVSYYFSARDAYRLEDVSSTDLSLTGSWKVGGSVEFYVAPQIYNVFNSQHVIGVNTAVNTAASNSSMAAFNPFTTSPIECPQGQTSDQCKAMGANWQKGPLFGQPTSPASYQAPRTFQVAVGVRF